MSVHFEQIIVKSPFTLLKGFALGYELKSNDGFKYFFNRKQGIKRESFGEHILNYFDMDQYCYMCVDSFHIEDFLAQLKKLEHMGIEVVKRMDINEASFHLDLTIYNKDMGEDCKRLIELRHPTLKFSDYDPKEVFDDSESQKVHHYTYQLKSDVIGPFSHIMDFYLSLQKSSFHDFVECSEIDIKTREKVSA